MSVEAINTRNQFRGKIKEIVSSPVVSEILVETPYGIVTSVITTRYAVLGKLADVVARRLEHFWLRWNPNYQAA